MQPRDRDLDRAIGDRVREAREAKGMPKVELARRLGRADANASAQKYEKGENGLSPADLLKIADLLDVSLDWLIRGVHPKGEAAALTPAEVESVFDHFGATPAERAAFHAQCVKFGHHRVTATYIDWFLQGRRNQHDPQQIERDAVKAVAREAAIAESGSAAQARPGELRRRKPAKK